MNILAHPTHSFKSPLSANCGLDPMREPVPPIFEAYAIDIRAQVRTFRW